MVNPFSIIVQKAVAKYHGGRQGMERKKKKNSSICTPGDLDL